jgi:hypothetical protein
MSDLSVPIMDWLVEANAVLNAHWISPEQPWEPRCDKCADGDCPALRLAEARVAEVWRLGERR